MSVFPSPVAISATHPASIAIVGASSDSTKRGYKAMVGLIKDGYAGAIYPINPKADMILGVKAYPSLEAIPGKVDLALICTPASSLPGLIAECGKKGVKGAVVLASGFKEIGGEGVKLEEQVLITPNGPRCLSSYPMEESWL